MSFFLVPMLAAALILPASLPAADLNIRLAGSPEVKRKSVTYECDGKGVKLGLPPRPFPVEYVNVSGNSLAILPVFGETLIFAGVSSGSGARYAAQDLIWWEAAGRSITLTSDSLRGKIASSCRLVR